LHPPFAGLDVFGGLLAPASQQLRQHQHPAADPVGQRQPGQPGGERDRHQQQRQQEHVAAQCAEAPLQRISHQPPQHTAAASRHSPVASVTDTSSSASRNMWPPSAPTPRSSELPPGRPSTPPPPAGSPGTAPMRRYSSPVAATRKPTMPTRRSAGPKSTRPPPAGSLPNSAIQATAPSTSGSR